MVRLSAYWNAEVWLIVSSGMKANSWLFTLIREKLFLKNKNEDVKNPNYILDPDKSIFVE